MSLPFAYCTASEHSYALADLALVGWVDATGQLSVLFTLTGPSTPFATISLSQIPILPQHIRQGTESPETQTPDQIPTMGCGPVVFDRRHRGEFMSPTSDRDHFNAGTGAVGAMEFVIHAGVEDVFTALQTGQIDMTAWRMEPGQIPLAEAENDPTVVSVPEFGDWHMTFSLRRAPLDDRAACRALTTAMDRERMVKLLLDGRGEVGTTVVALRPKGAPSPTAPAARCFGRR